MHDLMQNVIVPSWAEATSRAARFARRLTHSLATFHLGARDGLALWSKFGALADDDKAKARLAHHKPDTKEN